MRLAIQEHLLPGDSLSERLTHARDLGLDGVEFADDDLTAHVPEIIVQLEKHGLAASAVNVGKTYLLHPDFAMRDAEIVRLRQAMANTLDLGALGVVFVPTHPDCPRLPDLHPYKSALELEGELLVTQLRATLADFAYAIGAELYIQPVNSAETHLVRKLEHAATILRKNDDHPHIKIAANTLQMMLEGEDVIPELMNHIHRIHYLFVAGHNNSPNDHREFDLEKLISSLKSANYEGWITITPEWQPFEVDEFVTAIRAVM